MQITELRRMLREKDEIIKTFETDIVSLKKKLSRAQNEASSWQKRAEKTPAIQVLESELQNVKVTYFVLRTVDNIPDNL